MEGQNGDRRLQVMLDQEDRFLPTPNYLKRIQSASVLHQQRRMEILTAVYDVSSRCVYVYYYIYTLHMRLVQEEHDIFAAC